jgi:hypothetical protein
MAGSGKTGLVTVMVEEALRSGAPVLVVEVKGDLPSEASSTARERDIGPIPAAASLTTLLSKWGVCSISHEQSATQPHECSRSDASACLLASAARP